MANSKTILASDPQAIEKLTAKIKVCQEAQRRMKDVNAYFRKHGTVKGHPDITDDAAVKIDDRIERGFYFEGQPHSSYELQMSNREIRRLTNRIEEITRNREVGFSGWEFYDGRVEANTELNRLQIFFDEKPNEVKLMLLKATGFKWAPSQGAWQRQLTDNAIYAAGRLNFLAPLDGRTVREHQPRPPERGGEAR
jgi:hypothetical protein